MSERPVVHIIGNGKSAGFYDPKVKGIKYTCNLPPVSVPGVRATFIVDFKMCKAMSEGSVTVPGDWIMGKRPKMFCEMNPTLHMRWAPQIKEFYTDKPSYANNHTDFNCGPMAVYYAAKKSNAKEIHMYGFDSLFTLDLTSCTDFYLNSDRSAANNTRLVDNWRPIWENMFKEFSDTTFILYHMHDKLKINISYNVQIKVVSKAK